MRVQGTRTAVTVMMLVLGIAAALALGACGDSDEAAAPATATPSTSPTIIPAAEPQGLWDGTPGSATLAQTTAAAKDYAGALTNETFAAALYTTDATWDYWQNDQHQKGDTTIEGIYESAGESGDWSQGHLLVAPGVAAYEGMFIVHDNGTFSLPALSLLAVDGKKIAHEEIFLDGGPKSKKAVTFYGAAPGAKDTAKVASEVASAVGDAFAIGDVAALQTLLAPDILFYDTGMRRGVQGVDAVLAWQAKTPRVEVANEQPIAGQGWAVVRWTIREVSPEGVESAVRGATVMEVRSGKVVRMTLYYDNAVVSLQ